MNDPKSLKKYPVNFYGNKRKLLSSIHSAIPSEAVTVADVFCGTGIVSWYLKFQGYRMISNDIMRYPSTRVRALVKNNSEILTAEEIRYLCSGVSKRELSPVWETYSRCFGKENTQFLMRWAEKVEGLEDPVKKDIAVYIPILCIAKFFNHGAIHWGRDKKILGMKDLAAANLEKIVTQYAAEVFPEFLTDNHHENLVYNQDAISLIPKIEADVLYLDPPYASSKRCSYEADYGTLDDLVSVLNGQEDRVINPTDSKCELAPYTNFGSRTPAITGITKLFEKSGHIPTIIMSYNDTSVITPEEIGILAEVHNREVSTQKITVSRPSTKKESPKETNEYLITCQSIAA
jgi:adenine-specific DNA-methyltransferase